MYLIGVVALDLWTGDADRDLDLNGDVDLCNNTGDVALDLLTIRAVISLLLANKLFVLLNKRTSSFNNRICLCRSSFNDAFGSELANLSS